MTRIHSVMLVVTGTRQFACHTRHAIACPSHPDPAPHGDQVQGIHAVRGSYGSTTAVEAVNQASAGSLVMVGSGQSEVST